MESIIAFLHYNLSRSIHYVPTTPPIPLSSSTRLVLYTLNISPTPCASLISFHSVPLSYSWLFLCIAPPHHSVSQSPYILILTERGGPGAMILRIRFYVISPLLHGMV